uniref:Ankyrin repeat domain 2 n=1 Tax=Sphenodon punctatus TaxID=8508 RepID=A0A8D0HAF4_SPHPU
MQGATMDPAVKWVTELIDQKLALEEEQEVRPREGRGGSGLRVGGAGRDPGGQDRALLGQRGWHLGATVPSPQTGPVKEEAFLKATVKGKVPVVEKFLEDGGSPDTCDEFRRTALHRASLEGFTEIVEKLLAKGATVGFRDRLDSTAVHWACRGGHLEVVKLLKERGADLNVRDKEGDSALHDAVRLSRYKIIKMLILLGANMMGKNLAGKTPTDLVQLWQADTRHALEKPEPGTVETSVETSES